MKKVYTVKLVLSGTVLSKVLVSMSRKLLWVVPEKIQTPPTDGILEIHNIYFMKQRLLGNSRKAMIIFSISSMIVQGKNGFLICNQAGFENADDFS